MFLVGLREGKLSGKLVGSCPIDASSSLALPIFLLLGLLGPNLLHYCCVFT